MKALWHGETVSGLYRVLAGFLALAMIATMPFVLVEYGETSLLDVLLGGFIYLYIFCVFTCVALRGRAPTGVVPWC